MSMLDLYSNPGYKMNIFELLEKAGINNIFLEAYFHGKTIYPSAVLKKYKVTYF